MVEGPAPVAASTSLAVQYAILITVPIFIAAGQVLFKLASAAVTGGFSIRALVVNPYLFAALCLYALATGLWIHVLTRVDLVRAYPFAALSFVLVPLFSYLFLGERIGAPYAAGVALTALGVVLCQQ